MLAAATINSGDTAWVMVSAALVLSMIPGLAYFYADLVRGSNARLILQQNLIPPAAVTVTWTVVGYSCAEKWSCSRSVRCVPNR